MKLLFGPTLGLVLRPTYLGTLEVTIFYQRGTADCRGHVEANLLVLDETVLAVVLVALLLLLGGVRREICDVGVGDVCFFLTMRCFNDAMFSNS